MSTQQEASTVEYNEYESQAINFLARTGTTLKVRFLDYDNYFEDDKEPRDIFMIRMTRGKKQYSFKFGQSIAHSTGSGDHEPTPYDILSCLSLDYSGSFEDFCSEFGYSDDSISALKTYKAVEKQTKALQRLFDTEELEVLSQIR